MSADADRRRAQHDRPVRLQHGLLAQWQLRRQAQFLPLMVVVQVFLAVTTVIGYGLLVGDPDPRTRPVPRHRRPDHHAHHRRPGDDPADARRRRETEGSLDWMRTLPVPRGGVPRQRTCSVWTLLALPGMVLGVVAGALRFDVDPVGRAVGRRRGRCSSR